jgi:hypothetical protein
VAVVELEVGLVVREDMLQVRLVPLVEMVKVSAVAEAAPQQVVRAVCLTDRRPAMEPPVLWGKVVLVVQLITQVLWFPAVAAEAVATSAVAVEAQTLIR